MGDVLVLGGGICGLTAALLLARDGHDVTVIEADPHDPPDGGDPGVEPWDRPGVAQFHQGHYMHARFRHVIKAELPDVFDALAAAGCTKFDIFNEIFPSTIEDRSPRPGDDRHWTITGRRQVLESVFARAAANERGMRVVRGKKVAGFVAGTEAIAGVPHVVGARTADGEEYRADLVIDAMGRRSMFSDWVRELGGRPPAEEAEECGFVYYGRHFRSRDGKMPKYTARPLLNLGTLSTLTLPADNTTWVTVVFTTTGDMALKQLRFEDKWRKVMEAVPSQEQWLDGDPIGDFETMAGVLDRYRRFVVDGAPVATGVLAVADAWASTNPSLGRGVSLGVWQAQRLRDHVRSSNGDPGAVALCWDEITETEFRPWYDAQIQMDRARVAEIEALRQGLPAPDDPASQMTKAFWTSSSYDPDMYRALLEVMGCLTTPEEVLSTPGLFEKMITAGQHEEELAGPSREELLALVA